MIEREMHPVLRIITGIFRTAELGLSLVVHGFFFILIFMVLIAAISSDKPTVEKESALFLAPSGSIVEQKSSDPASDIVGKLLGRSSAQALLWQLRVSIDEAAEDERITHLVVDLDGFGGSGLSELQDVAAAMARFRETGKKIIATGDGFSTNSYYLAAQADEIVLHPMGMVMIEGYGRYRRYYKELLDKLEVDWNVFRVGTFKSAVEPYLRNDMSEADRRSSLEWMNDLWDAYKTDVAARRGKDPSWMQDYVVNYVELLEAAEGDGAKVALEAGVVDKLMSRGELRDYLAEQIGEDEDDDSGYRRIAYTDFLQAIGRQKADEGRGEGIGVIVAAGTIEDGTRGPGTIGGDSTAALIRKAREDEDIKAIVLRVDSPGGSAFASEVIRRELMRVKEDGKPFVVSMGGVAASGGYWISMDADVIYARPTTITGSIGIFGMFPTFQRTLAKIGVHTDGVGVTPLAGALRQDRAVGEEAGRAIQMMIEQGYREFITRVANGRGMTPEDVDKIGQGRVWSGLDAKEIGLVDELGDLEDAIAKAAELASLEEGFAVRYIEKDVPFKDQLLQEIFGSAAAQLQASDAVLPRAPGLRLASEVAEELSIFERMNDPRGIYAYCEECVLH